MAVDEKSRMYPVGIAGVRIEEQKREAEAFISQLQKSDPTGRPIVTELRPLAKFYKAEDYHHEHYRNNLYAPYCQVVISPKMEKLNKKFDAILKASK